VRAVVSASRGLPALPAPRALRGVVEAVVSTAAHLGLGSVPGPGAGDRGLGITNFRGNGINQECCGEDAGTKSPRRLLPPELGRLSQSPLPPVPLLRRYAIR
jgi:hypothetical protein